MKSAPVLLTLSDSKHVVLPVDDDSDLNVVAAFDRRGEYIYTGNAKGKVSPLCVLLLHLRPPQLDFHGRYFIHSKVSRSFQLLCFLNFRE